MPPPLPSGYPRPLRKQLQQRGTKQGMQATLDGLRAMGLPFAIATTSPKPRVPASVHACGLDDYFPPDKIHSGESDFDPPRFKPDPSVYHKVR